MARFQTIDEYIAASPDDLRPTLEAVRAAIHRAMPGAAEGISYGIPAVGPDGRFVVWFAGWKRHVSIYPVPSGDPSLTAQLEPYVASKGTLRFPLTESIPLDLIGRVASELLREGLTRAP
jgi:uncharacterized protein YdhG (YjbR/CyaY superfamily)